MEHLPHNMEKNIELLSQIKRLSRLGKEEMMEFAQMVRGGHSVNSADYDKMGRFYLSFFGLASKIGDGDFETNRSNLLKKWEEKPTLPEELEKIVGDASAIHELLSK